MSDLKAAKKAIVDRFRSIATEYKNAADAIEQLQQRRVLLETQASDCHAAARLFGFDLIAEVAAISDPTQQYLPEIAQPATPPAVPARPISVKQVALEAARAAYPNHIKASEIRQHLEHQGMMVHEKTVGMTLYRLLKQGVLKRRGFNWIFVPEEERQPVDVVDEVAGS